jgi:hypothetical protein
MRRRLKEYLGVLGLVAACGGELDAGWNLDSGAAPLAEAGAGESTDAGPAEPVGLLPVGPRNPVVLCNDGFADSWQGEYALLLAASTGPALVGIVVNAGSTWPDLDVNLAGWQQMVAAARASGAGEFAEPIASDAPVLVRPSDGQLEATAPNDSAGARFIVEASLQYASADLPLVVATGGRLTDVADAYLLDPSVPERVIVVASLGSATSTGARMGIPNGEMDTWAGVIVAQKFRYIQVSAHYDQLQDVPESLLPQLPASPLADWVKVKQPDVWDLPVAADQVSLLAVALPQFVTEVTRLGPPGTEAGIPELALDPAGNATVVTAIDSSIAIARFQQLLLALPSAP